MSDNNTFKVQFDGQTRKLVLKSSVSSYADLVGHISTLFDVDTSSRVRLQYQDADGDVVTLDTLDELREALQDGFRKFNLNVNNGQGDDQGYAVIDQGEHALADEDFDRLSTPLSHEGSQVGDEAIEQEEEHDGNTRPFVYDSSEVIESVAEGLPQTTSEVEANQQPVEEEQERPHTPEEKGKSPEATNGEQTAPQPEEKGESNSFQSEPPFLAMAREFEQLIDQFKHVFDQHPELIESANTLMEKVLQGTLVDLDGVRSWFEQQATDERCNAKSDKTNNEEEHDDDEEEDIYIVLSALAPHRQPRRSCWSSWSPYHGYPHHPFATHDWTHFSSPYIYPFYGSSPTWCQPSPWSRPTRGCCSRYGSPWQARSGCPCSYRRPYVSAPSFVPQAYRVERYVIPERAPKNCRPDNQSNAGPSCRRSCARPGSSAPSKSAEPSQQEQDLDINGLVSQLNAMGFYETESQSKSETDSFESLLKRYNGNLERVVEVLVQNQSNIKATTVEEEESKENKPRVEGYVL